MTGLDVRLVLLAAVLVVLAGALSAADAALASFSRARAHELLDDGRAGARRLGQVLDDLPRHLNVMLFLRMASEVTAIVVVTYVVLDVMGRSRDVTDFDIGSRWPAMLVAAMVMVVVSYVVVGVAPRTFGRQQNERVALLSAAPVKAATTVLSPLARALIWLGNVLTPGRGFSEGPFASEAELRELVDLAEASRVIESGERAMIHSVFELGDTLVREVMVPRTDLVFVERHKTLRQAMSLGLRSGYSRIPVIGDNLDEILGFAYLKDVTKRVFDNHEAESTERVESVMRPVTYVPDSKPVDGLLREMQAQRTHIAVVVDEYGGTAGIVTIEDILEEIVGEITDEYDSELPALEHLEDGVHRVTSRFPVDDLLDAVGVEVEEEDVETVGGLMAKHLGKVAIAGSVVEAHGLRFEAESTTGRRNQVGTVLIARVLDEDDEQAGSYAESHAGRDS